MKKLLLLLSACCGIMLHSAEQLWFMQDFENREFFNKTTLKDGKSPAAGIHKYVVAKHVKLIDHEGSQAIHLERIGVHHAMDFSGISPMPYGRNFVLEADIFLPVDKGAFYMFIFNDKNEKITGVNAYCNRPVMIPDRREVWGSSGIQIASGAYRLKVSGNANKGTCQVTVTDSKGNKLVGKVMPMVRNSTPAYVRFGTCPSQGNKFIIDNLKMSYSDHREINGRIDAALNAKIISSGISGKNVVSGTETLNGKNGRIEFELAEMSKLGSIRFSAPEDIKIKISAINNGGQTQILANDKNLVKIADGVYQADFKAGIFRTVILEFSGKKGDAIGKIGIYYDRTASQLDLDDLFIKDVYGEFDLPVYTGDQTGYLHLFNTTSKSIPVDIVLREKNNNKEISKLNVSLNPGKNEIAMPRCGSGYFVAEVVDMREPLSPAKGKFRRLMRRQDVPEPKPDEIVAIKGEKLFFADGYYFEKFENIAFKTIQADVYKSTPDNIDPRLLMQGGGNLAIKDGKLMQHVTCYDNYFRKSSTRFFIAETPLDNLNQWSIRELADGEKFPINAHALAKNVVSSDWEPKPGKDGKITYRFYDPARDGKVDVKQINFFYISPFGADAMIGMAEQDWGVIKPGVRSTWPIWYKAPGEALILTEKPLFSDDRSADEFEAYTDSNDNFCGQWLSDDGKTVYYCRGHYVRRYPPYSVPYDNMSNGVRLLTVTKTSDGINFERCFVTVPDRDEPLVGTQHYGAAQMRLRDGNGMRIALVSRYFAQDQRIFIELAYSYDGFNWKRFSGQKPLLDNGEPGSWIAGYIGGGAHAVEHDGKIYYTLGWCCTAYHFMAELIWERNLADTSGAFLKSYITPRKIDQWPLLDKFKDFDDMAAYVRNTRINAGVMSWRKDGLFYVEPQGEKGWFVTGKLRAGKIMTVNLRLEENGRAVFVLLDENDNELPGFRKDINGRFDGIDTVIFNDLPQGIFKVKCELEKGELYTLGF